MNVSKGDVAKADLIQKAFGDKSELEILQEILGKGELQVGEKERDAALSKMRREIATCLAGMSVNPASLRPYPVTLLEKAMKDIHFKADLRRPAKRQALDVLRLLEERMPISRANMRVRLSGGSVAQDVLDLAVEVESRGEQEAVVLVKPSQYREMEEKVKERGLEMVVESLAATKKGEATIEEVGEALQKMEMKEEDNANVKTSSSSSSSSSGNAGKKVTKKEEKTSKRSQKGQRDLSDLMGNVQEDEDSDDDWKNAKKKGGKGKKKR